MMKSLYRVVLAVAVCGLLLFAVAGFAQQGSDGKVGLSDWNNIIDSKVTD